MLKSPIEIGLGFDQVKSPIPFLLFFFSSFSHFFSSHPSICSLHPFLFILIFGRAVWPL
jgi:hypothetical protein